MVNVHLKDTNINITCETAEELHFLHFNLGHKYIFEINGVEIDKTGPIDSNNKNVKAYFAGYTREYFKKNFFS